MMTDTATTEPAPPLDPDDIWQDDTLTPEEQAIGYDLLVEDGGEEDDE